MTHLVRSAYAHLAHPTFTADGNLVRSDHPTAAPTSVARRRQSTAIPSCSSRAKRATRDNSVGDSAHFACTAHKLKTSEQTPGVGAHGGLAPQLSDLEWAERTRLALGWRLEAIDHHRSIAACARFAAQLQASGAPVKLVAAAQRAESNEIAHAELCLAMASAYADHPVTLGVHHASDRPGSLDDPIAIAVHTVRASCVGETVRAALATAAAQAASDSAVRRLLVRVAADETRHAGLAWRYLKWTLRHEQSPSLFNATAATFDAQLARVEGQLAAPPNRDDRWLAHHGLLTPAVRTPIALRCMHEVVIPCARALLAEVPQTSSKGHAADVA